LEDVSRTLGARGWQRLRHVTVPVIAAPVGAAAVLVLAFTMGSYEVPILLGRPFPAPLSVVTFQSFSDTDLTARPQAMAVAVLLAALTTVVAALYLVLVRMSRRSQL
ncbi:MAG: ABC transporter permease subunit, partial [Aeromicrobium sp.]